MGIFFTFHLFGDVHEIDWLKLDLKHKVARNLRMHRSDDDKLNLQRSSFTSCTSPSKESEDMSGGKHLKCGCDKDPSLQAKIANFMMVLSVQLSIKAGR